MSISALKGAFIHDGFLKIPSNEAQSREHAELWPTSFLYKIKWYNCLHTYFLNKIFFYKKTPSVLLNDNINISDNCNKL